ncbi:ABC transporter substrate-binding protein, partial [Candidatus Dependentiae bacterium]|nr:ABC transporter substrate-binding protein [Candidatus Dependentiae bacterium]
FISCSNPQKQSNSDGVISNKKQFFSSKKKIDIIRFTEYLAQSTEQKIKESLIEKGLREGTDFEIRSRSAQGDITNLTMLIDAAVSEKSDLIITFHSESLYVAVRRSPNLPVLFMLTSNPFILGAGNSDTEHLPNISGIYYTPSTDILLDLIKECNSKIRRIGTLFNIGNTESAAQKDFLVYAADRKNMKVISEGFSTQAEIADASASLSEKKIDCIIHIYDSFSEITLPSLLKLSQTKKIPIFGFSHSSKNSNNYVISVSRERLEQEKEFADMIIKVLQGTPPSNLPFLNNEFFKTEIFVNQKTAGDIEFKIPQNILEKSVFKINN